MRVDAENGATAGKFDLAKRANAANLDAIHDTVHELSLIHICCTSPFRLLNHIFRKIGCRPAISTIRPVSYTHLYDYDDSGCHRMQFIKYI